MRARREQPTNWGEAIRWQGKEMKPNGQPARQLANNNNAITKGRGQHKRTTHKRDCSNRNQFQAQAQARRARKIAAYILTATCLDSRTKADTAALSQACCYTTITISITCRRALLNDSR